MKERLNDRLSCKFSKKEIQAAIFDMDCSKALGLDLFPRIFFQTFWEIMGKEIVLVVQEFQVSKVMQGM